MLKANGYGDKILKKERHKNVENVQKSKKWAIFAYSGIAPSPKYSQNTILRQRFGPKHHWQTVKTHRK
jgi:hypothetical protein